MKLSRAIKPSWGILPVVIFVVGWEVISRCQLIENKNLLPSFSQVSKEFVILLSSGVLAENFMSSLMRVLIGFCSGSVAGLTVGMLMGWKQIFNRTLGPLISVLYPIPALGWLPLLILWIGVNNSLPVIIIFICSFFPVCYSTSSGIRNVDRNFIRIAQTLGSSEMRILFTVILPLALPSIFTGLRLEAGMAWRVIIAAEMIAIPTGIGALLMKAESLMRIDIIIVCLILLSLMCVCFEKFFIYLEHKLTGQWT